MLVQLPLLQVTEATFLRPRSLEVASEAEIFSLLCQLFPASSSVSFYLAFSPDRSSVSVRLRLPGGKGGFGSQLRAQGNKMSSKKRAGNYEACRDLSGQRLRAQKQAKLIAEYVEGEGERMSKREKEIGEKMARHLEAPHKKVMFSDLLYLKTSRKIVDQTEDAVRSLFGSDESEEEDDDDEIDSADDSEKIEEDVEDVEDVDSEDDNATSADSADNADDPVDTIDTSTVRETDASHSEDERDEKDPL